MNVDTTTFKPPGMTRIVARKIPASALLILMWCWVGHSAAQESTARIVESPQIAEILPEQFADLWKPYHEDLDKLIERRVIRVLVPFGGYQYYYVNGRPRGTLVELLNKFEQYVNDLLERRHLRVYVVTIPISRDHLIPYLLEGRGDLVAGDLTVTNIRQQQVEFTRPVRTDINEVIVTGPSTPEILSLDDLAGQEVVVRASSSYFEHLLRLTIDFSQRGLAPISIIPADELLEAEDLLELLDAGMIPATVMDDYKADFWSSVFPNISVRKDLSINDDGNIAWATTKSRPELSQLLNDFLKKFGRGTLVGNDTFNRHLANADRVRCQMAPERVGQQSELAQWFKIYGEQYDFDWLMLAAQGFQESRLNQSKRSPAGALGVMQIKPSTAADRNVNILDISDAQNNIHAGTKYMRFIADRYFAGAVDDLNEWFFSLAAYNAGPAKVAQLRREAEENGLDKDRWFANVEIVAARRIGRETVSYVANIFKYYIGYKMSLGRLDAERGRHAELTACVE